MAKKYYVVWQGRQTGVFEQWKDCRAAVEGFDGARYKSYPSQREAETAFVQGPPAPGSKPRSGPPKAASRRQDVQWLSISVDAACSGNPGLMEYQGVDTRTGQRIFHQGPFQDGTNNIGEFLAIVHALAMLAQKGYPELPIYTDSKTAMAWVRNKKAKTTLEKNARNAPLFDMLARAENWLHSHSFRNPILKWETEHWGEIPADFGRK